MGISNIETHFSEMNFLILLQLNAFVFALPLMDKPSNGFQRFFEGIDETLDDMKEAFKNLGKESSFTGAMTFLVKFTGTRLIMRLRTNLPIVQQVQCVRHAVSLVSPPKTTLTIGEMILQAAGNVLLPVVLIGACKHQIAKAPHTIPILNFAI